MLDSPVLRGQLPSLSSSRWDVDLVNARDTGDYIADMEVWLADFYPNIILGEN